MNNNPGHNKGDRIRFVAGTYAGYTGWYDNARKTSGHGRKTMYVYVIVFLDDGTEKATKVRKTSVRPSFKAPATYEEAIIQQHSDIEAQMIRLASMFATCKIKDDDEVIRLFREELNKAKTEQFMKGKRARWRHTNF